MNVAIQKPTTLLQIQDLESDLMREVFLSLYRAIGQAHISLGSPNSNPSYQIFPNGSHSEAYGFFYMTIGPEASPSEWRYGIAVETSDNKRIKTAFYIFIYRVSASPAIFMLEEFARSLKEVRVTNNPSESEIRKYIKTHFESGKPDFEFSQLSKNLSRNLTVDISELFKAAETDIIPWSHLETARKQLAVLKNNPRKARMKDFCVALSNTIIERAAPFSRFRKLQALKSAIDSGTFSE